MTGDGRVPPRRPGPSPRDIRNRFAEIHATLLYTRYHEYQTGERGVPDTLRLLRDDWGAIEGAIDQAADHAARDPETARWCEALVTAAPELVDLYAPATRRVRWFEAALHAA